MLEQLAPPELFGPEEAEVTLVGWGSTKGVIEEAVEKLAVEEGIVANHLNLKWIVPFHTTTVIDILSAAKRMIIVENTFSGQFARFLRSETGLSAHGHRDAAATDKDTLPGDIKPRVNEGDIVVCLGAGDITYWAADLPERLETVL